MDVSHVSTGKPASYTSHHEESIFPFVVIFLHLNMHYVIIPNPSTYKYVILHIALLVFVIFTFPLKNCHNLTLSITICTAFDLHCTNV